MHTEQPDPNEGAVRKKIGEIFEYVLGFVVICLICSMFLPVSSIVSWIRGVITYGGPSPLSQYVSQYLGICPYQRDLSADNTSSFTPYITGKIVVLDTVNEKIADANANSGLNAIRANDPNEVGTVICLYFRDQTVGSYDNGTKAIQQECDIIVIDKAKNLTVGKTTIDGPAPPQSAIRSSTDTSGGNVNEDDIANYILSLPIQ